MPATLEKRSVPVRREPVRQTIEVFVDTVGQIGGETGGGKFAHFRLVQRDDVQRCATDGSRPQLGQTIPKW